MKNSPNWSFDCIDIILGGLENTLVSPRHHFIFFEKNYDYCRPRRPLKMGSDYRMVSWELRINYDLCKQNLFGNL